MFHHVSTLVVKGWKEPDPSFLFATSIPHSLPQSRANEPGAGRALLFFHHGALWLGGVFHVGRWVDMDMDTGRMRDGREEGRMEGRVRCMCM